MRKQRSCTQAANSETSIPDETHSLSCGIYQSKQPLPRKFSQYMWSLHQINTWYNFINIAVRKSCLKACLVPPSTQRPRWLLRPQHFATSVEKFWSPVMQTRSHAAVSYISSQIHSKPHCRCTEGPRCRSAKAKTKAAVTQRANKQKLDNIQARAHHLLLWK